MAFQQDMEQAANRHYEDGRTLFDKDRFDNAGYHFGLAAECAIKHNLLKRDAVADDAAIWAHWPELRNLVCQTISGRQAAPILSLLDRPSPQYMQGWAIGMRYSANGEVDKRMANRWRDDANDALGLLL